MRPPRAPLIFLLAFAVACSGEASAPQIAPETPAAPPADVRPEAVATGGQAVFLDQLEPTELELPDTARPNGAKPPDAVAITGPFRYAGTTRRGLHQWLTPFPARPRGLFFHKAEPGMRLTLGGKDLPYSRFGPAKPMAWVHDRYEMTVYTADRTEPPSDGSLVLSWPSATQRERALNLETHGASPEDFLEASVADAWDVRRGLLVPAPGRVVYRLDPVPEAAELSLRPGIVPPELDEGIASDGATVRVRVRPEGGSWVEVAALEAHVADFPLRHVDLSAYTGQAIDLELQSDPAPLNGAAGGDPTLDYVFLGAPRVGTRRAEAPTVVMVFIDTLRPDHMSLYGYDRDTTAPLDERLADATVFTNARSIAPWTLPSARTALTGRKPEDWASSVPLPALFHARGAPTAFLAGNIYLSSQFGLDRGWDLLRVELWPSADDVTDDALRWLDEHEGMGGLLQVHYMDPHLPYLEPESHRELYADGGPGTLREQFHLSDVRKLGKKIQRDDATQTWIRDRYDNNVRYTADAVARLLDRLGDNDIVVLYSDHGEEFFEHTGFEHGHTLYDELLRVPLVVRAPGLPGGRFDTPVSLLDLAPTLTELAGLDPLPGVEGMSLAPIARGEEQALAAFAARPLGFGRLLYGEESWGLFHQGMKYTTVQGREDLFNLGLDPGEAASLGAQDPEVVIPYREMLPTALNMDIATGWRFQPTPARPYDAKPMQAICSFPVPIERAVASVDPLGNGTARFETIDADTARDTIESWKGADPAHAIDDDDVHVWMEWTGTNGREVLIQPAGDLRVVGHEVACTARWCSPIKGLRPCPTGVMRPDAGRDTGFGTFRTGLASVAWGRKRQLVWGLGMLPVPPEGGAVDGQNDELREALEAIGYVEGQEN